MRGQGVHRRLNGVDETAGPRQHDQDRARRLRADRHERQHGGARDGAGRHHEHGETRPQAHDHDGAENGADDAAEVERGEPVAGRAHVEPGAHQQGRHPADPDVHGQQAKEE